MGFSPCCLMLPTAEGGSRTLTLLPGQDFESCASASSATSATAAIIVDPKGRVNWPGENRRRWAVALSAAAAPWEQASVSRKR